MHTLQLSVTREEWRTQVRAAQLAGLSVSDHLRMEIGLVREAELPEARERTERERARTTPQGERLTLIQSRRRLRRR
jgi:hypothetical protein